MLLALLPVTLAFEFQLAPLKRRAATRPRKVKNGLDAKPASGLVLSCKPPYIVQSFNGGVVSVICPCCGTTNEHGPGAGLRGAGAEIMPNPAYMNRVCDGYIWGDELHRCPGYWLIPADETGRIEVCPVVREGWWPRTRATPYIDDTNLWRTCQEGEAIAYLNSDQADHSKPLSAHGFGKYALRAVLALRGGRKGGGGGGSSKGGSSAKGSGGGKGGSSGAGKGQGGGNSPAGWPSTTGKPSGGGRSNNPQKSK